MLRNGILGKALLSVACVGMVLPQNSSFAAGPSGTQPAAKRTARGSVDLLLHSEGLLVGRVVDSQGRLQKRVPVSVRYGRYEVARTMTDENGSFRVRGLRNGVHQLVAARASQPVRLWTKTNAPKSARRSVLLVKDTGVVLGNDDWCGECGSACGGSCGGGAGISGGELMGIALVAGAGVLGGVIGYNAGLDNADRPAVSP